LAIPLNYYGPGFTEIVWHADRARMISKTNVKSTRVEFGHHIEAKARRAVTNVTGTAI
jgi:hypothetical protein